MNIDCIYIYIFYYRSTTPYLYQSNTHSASPTSLKLSPFVSGLILSEPGGLYIYLKRLLGGVSLMRVYVNYKKGQVGGNVAPVCVCALVMYITCCKPECLPLSAEGLVHPLLAMYPFNPSRITSPCLYPFCDGYDGKGYEQTTTAPWRCSIRCRSRAAGSCGPEDAGR